MATKTWTTKLGDRVISMKMLKANANSTASLLRKAGQVPQYWRELTGTIGENERSATLMAMFGPGKGAGSIPPEYRQDVDVFYASIPDLLTPANVAPYLAAAKALFDKYLPVIDERKTPEEAAARNAEIRAMQEQQQAKAAAAYDADLAAYGEPDHTPVTRPEGYMVATIRRYYDDSDIMSDYFDRHHPVGTEFALAVVPKAAETQRLTRSIMERYPQLAELEWTWHTENYSMGHGNWLESDAIGQVDDLTTYGGHKNPFCWWEIRFNAWQKDPLPAFKGYAAANPTKTKNTTTTPSNGKPSVTRNEEMNGIEVKFASKPAQETLDWLKASGFRWSGRQQLWYTRYSPAKFDQAAARFAAGA